MDSACEEYPLLPVILSFAPKHFLEESPKVGYKYWQ